MNNPDVVEVTAEDREAMIAFEALSAIPLAPRFAEEIRSGIHDKMARLQLIARHRIAAHESALRQELEDAWTNAADWQRRFDDLAQQAERMAETLAQCSTWLDGFDHTLGGLARQVLATYRAGYLKDESNG